MYKHRYEGTCHTPCILSGNHRVLLHFQQSILHVYLIFSLRNFSFSFTHRFNRGWRKMHVCTFMALWYLACSEGLLSYLQLSESLKLSLVKFCWNGKKTVNPLVLLFFVSKPLLIHCRKTQQMYLCLQCNWFWSMLPNARCNYNNLIESNNYYKIGYGVYKYE